MNLHSTLLYSGVYHQTIWNRILRKVNSLTISNFRKIRYPFGTPDYLQIVINQDLTFLYLKQSKLPLQCYDSSSRQSVQEKPLWCTKQVKDGSLYRRSVSGVQTACKDPVKKLRGPYMRIGVGFCALSVWEFAKVLIINGCGPGVCPH